MKVDAFAATFDSRQLVQRKNLIPVPAKYASVILER
jgi:hypothetical protein